MKDSQINVRQDVRELIHFLYFQSDTSQGSMVQRFLTILLPSTFISAVFLPPRFCSSFFSDRSVVPRLDVHRHCSAFTTLLIVFYVFPLLLVGFLYPVLIAVKRHYYARAVSF
jgi:hypothetical protein